MANDNKKSNIVPFKPKPSGTGMIGMYNKQADPKQKEIAQKQSARASNKVVNDPLNKPVDYKYLDDKGWWARDTGVSQAGAMIRDYKHMPENKEGDKAGKFGPYDIHMKVLNALKNMKKPDLTRNEDLNKANPVKIGVSPKALKQQSAQTQPVSQPKTSEYKPPTHISGVEIPHELHEHQGIVPREHPHREIAAKFVGDVWKKNKLEGKRMSEKYLGVGENGKAQHTPTQQQYTTLKSEQPMSKGKDQKTDQLHRALKQMVKQQNPNMTHYLPPVNPKDPILNYGIPKKTEPKTGAIKTQPDNKAPKSPNMEKTVNVISLHESKNANNKVEGLDKVDPTTKLPGILLNKQQDPDMMNSLCKAIMNEYKINKALTCNEDMNKAYASDAQRRWAHTSSGEKALGKEGVKEFDEKSKGLDLPEKVNSDK